MLKIGIIPSKKILIINLYRYIRNGSIYRQCHVHSSFIGPLQLSRQSNFNLFEALSCSAIGDLSVWHLTQASFCSLSLYSSEASLGLPDVDLSTRAWYLVYDVRLILDGERVFDLEAWTGKSGQI